MKAIKVLTPNDTDSSPVSPSKNSLLIRPGITGMTHTRVHMMALPV